MKVVVVVNAVIVMHIMVALAKVAAVAVGVIKTDKKTIFAPISCCI